MYLVATTHEKLIEHKIIFSAVNPQTFGIKRSAKVMVSIQDWKLKFITMWTKTIIIFGLHV